MKQNVLDAIPTSRDGWSGYLAVSFQSLYYVSASLNVAGNHCDRFPERCFGSIHGGIEVCVDRHWKRREQKK